MPTWYRATLPNRIECDGDHVAISPIHASRCNVAGDKKTADNAHRSRVCETFRHMREWHITFYYIFQRDEIVNRFESLMHFVYFIL